jgi:hypothetical protein
MASSRLDRALSEQIKRSVGCVALAQSKLAACEIDVQARRLVSAAIGTGLCIG